MINPALWKSYSNAWLIDEWGASWIVTRAMIKMSHPGWIAGRRGWIAALNCRFARLRLTANPIVRPVVIPKRE